MILLPWLVVFLHLLCMSQTDTTITIKPLPADKQINTTINNNNTANFHLNFTNEDANKSSSEPDNNAIATSNDNTAKFQLNFTNESSSEPDNNNHEINRSTLTQDKQINTTINNNTTNFQLNFNNETIDSQASISKTDNNSFASVHILITPPFDYYSKKCSIYPDTLLNLCSDEIHALNKSLQIVAKLISSSTNQSSTDDLKKYKDILCPSSDQWMSFTHCYCTKCESELSKKNIPNHSEWYKIWNDVSFCGQHKEYANLCKTIQNTALKDSEQMNLDVMFKTAWNAEINAKNIIEKTKSQVVEDEIDVEEFEEIMEIDGSTDTEEIEEINSDKDYPLTSVSSMLETNPLIYIWTFIFASCITLFSFFMFYR